MNGKPRSFNILLHPESVALIILDHQDNLLGKLATATRKDIAERTIALIRLADACGIPILLTSVQSDPFRGDIPSYLLNLGSTQTEIRRTQINCWDDVGFVDKVKESQRERLLFAGLCTETAVSLAALTALELGHEAFLVTDATATISPEAHRVAIRRMIQAGVVPVTWRQVLFEMYRGSGGPDGPLTSVLTDLVRQCDAKVDPSTESPFAVS